MAALECGHCAAGLGLLELLELELNLPQLRHPQNPHPPSQHHHTTTFGVLNTLALNTSIETLTELLFVCMFVYLHSDTVTCC